MPFQDLAQRIEHQQAELDKLRQEYESQQARWRDLTSRREELQAQLAQVEAEMQRAGAGNTSIGSAGTPKVAPETAAKHGPSRAGTKPAEAQTTTNTKGVTLAQLLVRLVAQAGQPITVKELTHAVEQRKYPTTSRHLHALVETRVGELVKRGLLRRSANPPGVVPAQPPEKAKLAAKSVRSKPDAALAIAKSSNGEGFL